MQFKSKLNGDVVHAYNVADIKSYESSQGWEVVKDTAKQEKEKKTKALKEKTKSLFNKLFKD